MEKTEGAKLRQPKDDGVQRHSGTKRYSEILRDFDNLDLSLVNVSEDDFLPDTDTQSLSETADSTMDDLANEDVDSTEICNDGEEKESTFTAQNADLAMCRCEGGVELALQYAKMWCRYAKDLLTWMDKRISLEQEFAKSITKAADAAKSCIAQQDLMPLQYIYLMALEHDIKSSSNAKHTNDHIQQRCYQALSAKRNEIDKWRREFKEQWAKEQRKMNDAVAALKRAQKEYQHRCEELEKAKAITAKGVEEAGSSKTLDKRKKSRDEAQTKFFEAEHFYRQCVDDARAHQDVLEKVKERIIVHTRKLICQGDNVLKEVTVNMFFYQRQQTEPVPQGFHNLEVTCRPCEAGEPYLNYISKNCRQEQPLQNFIFQELIPQSRRTSPVGRRKVSNPVTALQDSFQDDRRCSTASDGKRIGCSDSDSMGGSLESLTSPARKLPKAPSTGTMSSDDLDERDASNDADCTDPLNESNGSYCKFRTISRAALTHRLKKMKSKVGKCRQCDNFILVNGIECEECGLSVHRKCLDMCQLECEHRRGNLFGVDVSLLPIEQPQEVPFIVHRCTEEIESRALTVQGVYRISGSKPRIVKLCQAFETQKDQVDLSDLSPHDITSVLKFFFKELPEPLLTYDLYNDFIAVGKEIQRLTERDHADQTSQIEENIVSTLKQVLGRLPPCNYRTLNHMMTHLYRISHCFEENKMSPGNLGIIFGPTLLRPLVSGDVSMIALLESSYQAMVVEFLISHHDQVFGPAPRPHTPPPPVPTAPLPDTPPRPSCPGTQESAESGALTRERPRSLERRTLKRDSSEGYISDKSSSNEAVDQLSPEANERAVLAMRNVATALRGHSGPQPRSHFSRQPVKHQRQVCPATWLPMAAGSGPGLDEPAAGTGMGDPRANACTSCRCSLDTKPPRQTPRQTHTPHSTSPQTLLSPPCESGHIVRPGPAVTSNPKSILVIRAANTEKGSCLVHQSINQSNSEAARESEGQVQTRTLRRNPAEERTAQKILSGLKLRRSNSRKGEQLHFV